MLERNWQTEPTKREHLKIDRTENFRRSTYETLTNVLSTASHKVMGRRYAIRST